MVSRVAPPKGEQRNPTSIFPSFTRPVPNVIFAVMTRVKWPVGRSIGREHLALSVVAKTYLRRRIDKRVPQRYGVKGAPRAVDVPPPFITSVNSGQALSLLKDGAFQGVRI